nr:DNA-directed RNA polymerase subunit [Cedratvirus plubellavi]
MEGVNTITLEDLLLPEQKLESSLNLLPEEVLCIIFSYLSAYMFVARGVCRKWHRIYSDFPDKTLLLLLAYIYKDNAIALKEEYELPGKIGGLYKRKGFSYLGVEKLIQAIIAEGNPQTLTWMLKNGELHCSKRILFSKAVKSKNYKVLNWMKDQGMINSGKYFRDLLQAYSPMASLEFCVRNYAKFGDKQMLSWYLCSSLPRDPSDVDSLD